MMQCLISTMLSQAPGQPGVVQEAAAPDQEAADEAAIFRAPTNRGWRRRPSLTKSQGTKKDALPTIQSPGDASGGQAL